MQTPTRLPDPAQSAEMPGQPVRALVQFPIGPRLAFVDDRDCVRRAIHLRFEELVQAAVAGEFAGRGVPIVKHLPPLVGGQHRQIADRCGGVLGKRFQECPHMAEQSPGRCIIDPFVVVEQP